MKKIKLNDYQNIFYFVWDNTEDTINMLSEYLNIVKGANWSCGRCWNELTESNTSDTLFISEKTNIFGVSQTNSFYYVGDYVIDFSTHFRALSKEDFDKGDFIEQWKDKWKLN